MFDLHSHILPGVDDGPASWAGTLEMLELAEAHGTSTIVATPHTHQGWRRSEPAQTLIADLVAETQNRARAAGLTLRILPGQECYFDADLVRELDAGRRLTLGDSRTVLLELPFTMWPTALDRLIYDLQLAGYTVLLAHPERYTAVQKEPNRLVPLVERGVYMQVTSVAVTGRLGRAAQRTARLLVEHGLCHVIASDAHDVRGRPPMIDLARAAVSEWIGDEAAWQMVRHTPRALVENRPAQPLLEPRPVVRSRQRSVRGLLHQLFQ